MSSLEFVDELPQGDSRRKPQITYASLLAEPGRWAKVATYPESRMGSAYSRGVQFTKRHPDVEYAVRCIDGCRVLFMRAVKK